MNTVGGLQGNRLRASAGNTLVGPVQPGFGPPTIILKETMLTNKGRKMDTSRNVVTS